jgi:hypothetical protein
VAPLLLCTCIWTTQAAAGSRIAAASDQAFPEVAFDGTNYFVVWQDSRTGTHPDIYGTRVTKSGVALDPNGIPISTAWNEQSRPALAFDGTNYLIAWHDYRAGNHFAVYFTRLSTSGAVLDPDGIGVSATATQQMSPAVAFDGTNYLVVWQDLRNGNFDIYGTRIGKSGAVLDPGGIAISTAPALQAHPTVAFDGLNYLVVWDDERSSLSLARDVYGCRVNALGAVLDPGGIQISSSVGRQEFPCVAYGGGSYMVAWQDDRSGFGDIYGCRVSTAGFVLDAGGIPICTETNDQAYPSAVFDGASYVTAWQDYRAGYFFDIYGARVGVSGAVLDSAGICISAAGVDQQVPDIGFDGTNCMVVWQDNRGDSYDVYAARVDTAGEVLDPGGITDVLFTSASASIDRGCVTVAWQTSLEMQPYAFSLERAQSREGPFLSLGTAVAKVGVLSFSSTDCSAAPGMTFWYRIALDGPSGEAETYGPIEVRVDAAPAAYGAHEAYPNPFNPACTISYELPEGARVSLRVFDVGGSLVRTLVDGWRERGVHAETWNGRADDSSPLPSGIYIYSIKAGEFAATSKMLLMR